MFTWTPTQLRQYLDYVKDDRLWALWVLMVTTGIRRGEAAGLRWSALDLDAGRLRVEKTRVVVNFEVVDSGPKTAKSGRDIGLDPQTVAALRSHLVPRLPVSGWLGVQPISRQTWCSPGRTAAPTTLTC